MKSKVLNFLLIATSLFGYLEWGGDKHAFLFQAEAEIFQQLPVNPSSAIHPFTIIPLIGQLLLFITLFQKKPGKVLTILGITCLGLLLVFMFVIGLPGLNYKIVLSTIPFLVLAVWTIIHHRRMRHTSGSA